MLLTACGDNADRIADLESQIADLEGQVEQAESTTTTTFTTTTLETTTTTAPPSLTAAQETYCDDLTSVAAVRTETGGTRARPETVEFFDIAHRLDYLNLPFTSLVWGEARATTPEEFVNIARTFFVGGGVLETDVDDKMREAWEVNLRSESDERVDFDAIYTEVCLQAWELR